MAKIVNFALKIKGVIGRVTHAKSSDLATPPKKLESAPIQPFRSIHAFFLVFSIASDMSSLDELA